MQRQNHDRHAVEREISVDDNVFIKNWGKGDSGCQDKLSKVLDQCHLKSKLVMELLQDQIRTTCAENDGCGSATPDRMVKFTSSALSADQAADELVGKNSPVPKPQNSDATCRPATIRPIPSWQQSPDSPANTLANETVVKTLS
uniref:Uncharacterized protein n=1 Tax=Elysia chlorotica TaxID=188477 RepID=A0A1S5V2M3_ELYCH|nr:hypothetical protein [Elysia chlorotica]